VPRCHRFLEHKLALRRIKAKHGVC
jgi:hypothetical protein